jgi:ComF family protein
MSIGLSNSSRRFLAICTKFAQQAIAPQCLLCGAQAHGQLLCGGCRHELPRLPAARCVQCALPLTAGERCGACLAHPPAYDQVCAPWIYDFPTDALVQGLKYRGLLALAPLLGEAIAACIPACPGERPDVLVPMPLSAVRLRQRGFNQAQEIARHAARASGLPLLPQACRRVRDTPPQAALPWKERARNMRRAFVCDADFSGKHVAVVDDVMTTGATLGEIARNLKQAGALRVSGLVAARTLPGMAPRAARDV